MIFATSSRLLYPRLSYIIIGFWHRIYLKIHKGKVLCTKISLIKISSQWCQNTFINTQDHNSRLICGWQPCIKLYIINNRLLMLNILLIIRWLVLLFDNHRIRFNLCFCLDSYFTHLFLWIVWFRIAYFIVYWKVLFYYCHFFLDTVAFLELVYFFLTTFVVAFYLRV